MDVIKVDKMTKDYGSGRGIFNVSLHVEPGEVFGFLGPNGAGKSTTIRHLMGFSAPDSGSASIFGRESFGHYYEFLGRVGYIPGEVALPRGLTGSEFISMMQSMQGVRNDAKLKEMLSRFELDKNTLKQETKRMSLGVKRKLAVVTAFMHDPEVLVLDEPREASEMFHSTNSAQNPAFCGLWVHSLKTSDKVLKYGENNRVDFSEHPTVVKRGSVRTINIYAAVPDVA